MKTYIVIEVPGANKASSTRLANGLVKWIKLGANYRMVVVSPVRAPGHHELLAKLMGDMS